MVSPGHKWHQHLWGMSYFVVGMIFAHLKREDKLFAESVWHKTIAENVSCSEVGYGKVRSELCSGGWLSLKSLSYAQSLSCCLSPPQSCVSEVLV